MGAIVLYDLTDSQTFQNLEKWISEIKSNSQQDIKILLVGNKKDLVEKRLVKFEDAARFAKDNKLAYLEASAKNGELVIECFETVVKQIYKEQVNKDVTTKVSQANISAAKPPQALDLNLDNEKKGSKKYKQNCCNTN